MTEARERDPQRDSSVSRRRDAVGGANTDLPPASELAARSSSLTWDHSVPPAVSPASDAEPTVEEAATSDDADPVASPLDEDRGDDLAGMSWAQVEPEPAPPPEAIKRPEDAPSLHLPRSRPRDPYTEPGGMEVGADAEDGAEPARSGGEPDPRAGQNGDGNGGNILPDADPLPDSPVDMTSPRVVGVGDDDAAAFLTGPTESAPREPETSADLTAEALLRPEVPAPGSLFGRAVYGVTGGRVTWESRAERRRRERTARAKTAIAGTRHRRVAVLSGKGGVGKTSVAMVLGLIMAELRGDRVIALDANPDQGTLAERVRTETAATVRDLLAAYPTLTTYAAVRGYTSQSSNRLEVLASDPSATFRARDYRIVAEVIERFYSVLLTDTGTDLSNDALAGEDGVLDMADQVVLVCGPALDEAKVASATLDMLERQGGRGLVERAVVAINCRVHQLGDVDLDALERHFRTRVPAVVRIPFDAHLRRGSIIDVASLHSRTRDGFLELAAAVGAQFSH